MLSRDNRASDVIEVQTESDDATTTTSATVWLPCRRLRSRLPDVYSVPDESVGRMAAILSEVHVFRRDRIALSWLWLPAGAASFVQRSSSASSALQRDGVDGPALADVVVCSGFTKVSGVADTKRHGASPSDERSTGDVYRDCRDRFLAPAEYPLLAV